MGLHIGQKWTFLLGILVLRTTWSSTVIDSCKSPPPHHPQEVNNHAVSNYLKQESSKPLKYIQQWQECSSQTGFFVETEESQHLQFNCNFTDHPLRPFITINYWVVQLSLLTLTGQTAVNCAYHIKTDQHLLTTAELHDIRARNRDETKKKTPKI